MADNLLQRLSNRFIWIRTSIFNRQTLPTKFPPYLESIPIIYRKSNLVSFCLASRSSADKESPYPVVLPPHKDKLSVSSGFRESAVSLSLSYISMVFLAFRFLFLVNGIFCVCISLTESPLSGLSNGLESLYEIKQKVRHFQSEFFGLTCLYIMG